MKTNETVTKRAADLLKGDRILLDGDNVRITGVRKYGTDEVQISFRFDGETERALYKANTMVKVFP